MIPVITLNIHVKNDQENWKKNNKTNYNGNKIPNIHFEKEFIFKIFKYL